MSFNELLKQDLFDLAKVNIPSAGALVAVKKEIIDFVVINSSLQDVIMTLILFVVLVYNVFKMIDMMRLSRWKKEDRLNNNQNAKP